MFDMTTLNGQRELRDKGYCSLCGINKAGEKIGNRQVCIGCKDSYDLNPTPDMYTVLELEKKAVETYRKREEK